MASVVLLDFGNTLVDETFMRRDSAAFPQWTDAYTAAIAELGPAWYRGEVGVDAVVALVARRLRAPATAVRAYVDELCRTISFFPGIHAAVATRRARCGIQALVTVNPDLIDDICRHYKLHESLDPIVTSWREGTDDKITLCCRALELLGREDRSETVLIDNVASNVSRWIGAGGKGYLFRTDAQFVGDVRAGLVPGFDTEDISDA